MIDQSLKIKDINKRQDFSHYYKIMVIKYSALGTSSTWQKGSWKTTEKNASL